MKSNINLKPLLLSKDEEVFVRKVGLKYFPDMFKYLRGEAPKKYATNEKEIDSIRQMIKNLKGTTVAERRANLPKGFLAMYLESDIRMSRIYALRLVKLSSVILEG